MNGVSSLRDTLDRLLDGHSLSQAEAEALFTELTSENTPPAVAGAVLAALRAKGVTADELRGFAMRMRAMAVRPHWPPVAGTGTSGVSRADASMAVDIVGTGGDKSSSLNLSSGASLLAAACGIPIIKHGNRSISSRAGSADMLQALGLPMPLDVAAAGRCFQALGFTFLFAPYYHPAARIIAPVRQALGVRTVFNILGPLSNPASPPFLVVGAYDLPTAELMAQALHGTPLRRAYVIHGAAGWDEPTPIGPFTLFEVDERGVTRSERDPLDYGLPRCAESELRGGEADHNAAVLVEVLRGELHGPARDALLLGAALALQVSGREVEPKAAVARAASAIDDGAATQLLQNLRAFAAAEAARAAP